MTNRVFARETYFWAGVLVTTVVLAMAASAIVYRIGPMRVWLAVGLPGSLKAGIPEDIWQELEGVGAVMENVRNVTPPFEHDNVLVRPDPVLEYRLRPNARVDAAVLPSSGGFNLDPPVLNVPADATLSERARTYIRQTARMQFSYTTDAQARRMTMPAVAATDKILMVGDSVTFGVGVNDKDTIASQLQQILGSEAQVINGGVGGYDGLQVAGMADELSSSDRYATAIYVACQNDFMLKLDSEDWMDEANRVLNRFRAIASRFDRILVVLETHLEYEARDVLLAHGWTQLDIERTDKFRVEFSAAARAAGFLYADWSTIVSDHRRASGTVLSPFALYVDSVHLSRTGTRLLAAEIASVLHAASVREDARDTSSGSR